MTELRVTHLGLQTLAKILRDKHFPGLDLGWVAFCHLPADEHGRSYNAGPGPHPPTFNRAIFIAKKLQANHEEIRSTLLHEMIHLDMADKGLKHEDHGEGFANECLRLGLDPEAHCFYFSAETPV